MAKTKVSLHEPNTASIAWTMLTFMLAFLTELVLDLFHNHENETRGIVDRLFDPHNLFLYSAIIVSALLVEYHITYWKAFETKSYPPSYKKTLKTLGIVMWVMIAYDIWLNVCHNLAEHHGKCNCFNRAYLLFAVAVVAAFIVRKIVYDLEKH